MSRNRSQSDDRALLRHYILICWHDGHRQGGWRFTLVDARTQERRSFLELTALADFLGARLAQYKEMFDE